MNKKQRKTLQLIFKSPTASDVKWNEIETLFINLGARIK